MRAALYTRVSSQEQAQHGVSLAEQRERLEAWARVEGWEIANIYVDEGYSGGTGERPELKQLMVDARAQLFDVVAVTKIDRFFRNTRQLLNHIHELELNDVIFVAQSEGIDTSKPGVGNIILNLLGSVAQWEGERIGERIKNFRGYLAKKGQWSSGRTPFGYRFDKVKKELLIDPLEAEAIKFIYNTYVNNEIGIVRTAELCNKEELITPRAGRRKHTTWTQSAIRHVLTHPAYKGGPNDDWIFKTPAIIASEIWDAAQRQLSSNRHFRETDTHSPYQGLLRCGLCNHTLRIGWSHNKYRKWECPGRLKRLHLDDSPRCQLPRLDAEKLESKLSDKIINIFKDPELLNQYIADTIKDLQKERRELERKLKPIRGSIDQLKGKMEQADTMYEAKRLSRENYLARIAGLRVKISELERQTDAADPLLLRQLDDNSKALKYWDGYKKFEQFSDSFSLKKAEFFKEFEQLANTGKFDEILNDNSENPAEYDNNIPTLTDADFDNAFVPLPDAAIIDHPHEVGSRQLRKLGLFVYIYPDKLEIKGSIRQTHVTAGYSEDINLPLCIRLELDDILATPKPVMLCKGKHQ